MAGEHAAFFVAATRPTLRSMVEPVELEADWRDGNLAALGLKGGDEDEIELISSLLPPPKEKKGKGKGASSSASAGATSSGKGGVSLKKDPGTVVVELSDDDDDDDDDDFAREAEKKKRGPGRPGASSAAMSQADSAPKRKRVATDEDTMADLMKDFPEVREDGGKSKKPKKKHGALEDEDGDEGTAYAAAAAPAPSSLMERIAASRAMRESMAAKARDALAPLAEARTANPAALQEAMRKQAAAAAAAPKDKSKGADASSSSSSAAAGSSASSAGAAAGGAGLASPTKSAAASGSAAAPGSAAKKPKRPVVLKIRGGGEAKAVQIKIDVAAKFKRAFNAFAEQRKQPRENFVFSFDGDNLSDESTPEGVGMESGDDAVYAIDVVLKA